MWSRFYKRSFLKFSFAKHFTFMRPNAHNYVQIKGEKF